MADAALYKAAVPYADDVLALPVRDIEQAAKWYCQAFGLREVERRTEPIPSVILERDGVQLGFAINGGDPEQAGAAISVTDIHRAKAELEANDVQIANWRIDERDGQKLRVFFVDMDVLDGHPLLAGPALQLRHRVELLGEQPHEPSRPEHISIGPVRRRGNAFIPDPTCS